jgi:uncharacterized protein (DUF1810 family)
MTPENNLKRYLDAQENSYESALSELRKGRKTGHWMWYIFPQIKGLGFSETSRFYGINNLDEARQYLDHPVLGSRLVTLCNVLLDQKSNDATRIFGTPDDLKLKSCMTLFDALPGTNSVFGQVLEKFYNGSKDAKTLQLTGSKL